MWYMMMEYAAVASAGQEALNEFSHHEKDLNHISNTS
jgi:hypothetical protein